MPLSGVGSYRSTMFDFILHWRHVDAALPDPLIIGSAYALADLEADRDTMEALDEAVDDAEDAVNNLRWNRTEAQKALRERIRQFNSVVRGFLLRDRSFAQLPKVPQMDDSEADWRKAMNDTEAIWARINTDPPAGFTPPLILLGNFALADFTAAADALKQIYEDFSPARDAVVAARAEREALMKKVRMYLAAFRPSVEGRFPAGHSMIDSIPRLYPRRGHTPDAVTLLATWNEATGKVDLSWTASSESDIKRYSIRFCSGDKYDVRRESVLASVDADTTTFSTDVGLAAPGAKMSFKVYVILEKDNEKGSNAVTVERIAA